MVLLNRIKSFTHRTRWLSRFMPSIFHTVYSLISMKLNASTRVIGHYKSYKFQFYLRDMSAIKEVLVDQEYNFLTHILKNTSHPIIIDAGGNIGMFALWALGENEKADILSLEASPDTYKTIQANANFASEHGLSWTCQNGAAWNSNDHVSFSSEGDSMGHKVLADGSHKVPGVTLQQLVEQRLKDTGQDQIDLLKVDIEGAEEAFLEDTKANRVALSKVRHLVIELHPDYCNTAPAEAIIKACFKHVEDQQEDRVSTKPLLHCYN